MFKKFKNLKPNLSLSESSSINIIEGNHFEKKIIKKLRSFAKEGDIRNILH